MYITAPFRPLSTDTTSNEIGCKKTTSDLIQFSNMRKTSIKVLTLKKTYFNQQPLENTFIEHVFILNN